MNAKPPSAPATKIVSLYKMIDNLLNAYKETAVVKKMFFVNEVPKTLSIPAAMLSDLLNDLKAAISENPGKNCMRISVKNADQAIRLQIKPAVITGFRFSGTRVRG